MRGLIAVAALATSVCAYPAVTAPEDYKLELDTRGIPLRHDEKNSGFFPNTAPHGTFIDVRPGSGHEFRAPRQTDIRGPCPGLNAAANHGFTSRTGINDYTDTTMNLPNAIGISHEFTNILFVFATVTGGSIIDMKWSIGGPMKTTSLGLLGKGLGITNTHNQYEADSSPGRGDAYLHNGDTHSLNLPNFSSFYNDPEEDGNYGFRSIRRQTVRSHEFSKKHNPYVFFGPSFFVSPIAHMFVIAMMSNYSPDYPQGQLTPHTLRTFFSVKEKKNGKLEWIKGHDAIPYNWWRRPANNLYGTEASFGDAIGITCAQTATVCELGGGLGKPGSFAGLDFDDITGGLYKSKDILKGNNAACLGLEAITFAVPGAADKLLHGVSKFAKLFQSVLGDKKRKLGCPQLTQFNMKPFKRYPGFTWKQPVQPPTPY